MSTALHLAKPDDLPRLLPLVAACHEESGLETDGIEDAIRPLLGEMQHLGAIYLLGPSKAPVGYVILTFAWSVRIGGMIAHIEELFVRPGVRGRGLSLDTLIAIRNMLKTVDIRAILITAPSPDRDIYRRAGFAPDDAPDRLIQMLMP